MEIDVNVLDENVSQGLANFHRVILTKTLGLAQDSAERAATHMRIRMPHASFKSAEGVHVVGPELRSGPFGHPEVQYTAETAGDREDATPYFFWGTGLWGALHRKYGPRRAKALRFKRFDGGNYTAVVKGQRPQRLWFEDSKRETGNYVRARIEKMLNELRVTGF